MQVWPAEFVHLAVAEAPTLRQLIARFSIMGFANTSVEHAAKMAKILLANMAVRTSALTCVMFASHLWDALLSISLLTTYVLVVRLIDGDSPPMPASERSANLGRRSVALIAK